MAQFDNQYQLRIHARYSRLRDRAINALYDFALRCTHQEQTEEQRQAAKIRSKICECGRFAALYSDSETGELITSSARCKSRICPRCAAIRAYRVRDSIIAASRDIDDPRFVTLTPKHSDEPLREQIADLRSAFVRLRRSKPWREKVIGCIAVLEVKWSPRSEQWHPHLHLITDGDYWPQRALSDAWQQASRGAPIVHIRKIHRRSDIATYVSKYVTDTSKNDSLPYEKLAEYALAMHGLRLISSTGKMHGRIRESAPKETRAELEHVAHLGALADEAYSGNLRASRILRGLAHVERLQRRAGTEGLSESDKRRRRTLTRLIRAGWSRITTKRHNHVSQESEDTPRCRSPGNRSERLWQEPVTTRVAEGNVEW